MCFPGLKLASGGFLVEKRLEARTEACCPVATPTTVRPQANVAMRQVAGGIKASVASKALCMNENVARVCVSG